MVRYHPPATVHRVSREARALLAQAKIWRDRWSLVNAFGEDCLTADAAARPAVTRIERANNTPMLLSF
jgi:hypothetical protein